MNLPPKTERDTNDDEDGYKNTDKLGSDMYISIGDDDCNERLCGPSSPLCAANCS